MTISKPAPDLSPLARAPIEPPPSPPAGDGWLGPAEVLAVLPRGRVSARLDDATATTGEVELALAYAFVPQVGDRLLVLAQGGRRYAVGVLGGTRPATLQFPGDVDVRAVGGTLTLASDHAVTIAAPKVVLRAGTLRTLAHSVVEKAGHAVRWVQGLLAIRAGTSQRTIDGDDSTRCTNSTTLAKGTVTVDGDRLHLGH